MVIVQSTPKKEFAARQIGQKCFLRVEWIRQNIKGDEHQ